MDERSGAEGDNPANAVGLTDAEDRVIVEQLEALVLFVAPTACEIKVSSAELKPIANEK